MMESLLSPTLLLLIFFLLCTTTSGQLSAPAQAPSQAPSGSTTTAGQSSPPAPSPSGPLAPSASSSPADIVAILRKARKFSTFIGLLKSTQMDAEINSELKKKSIAGFTIFAPTDSAFSDLKTGTLNSFTDNQKAALTKFHIINSFLTISQFQTVSNPLHTSANGNTKEFPLNVIGNGTQVNMTTGLVNTPVDSTVYSDGQLAVYEIPQVLLSQGILRTQAPAPAPLPPKPKKVTPLNSQAPSRSTTSAVDSSDGTALPHHAPIVVSIGVAVLAALRLCL